MAEIFLKGIEVCVVLAGGIASIYAGKLWLQAQKHRNISEAKDEAIRVASNNAEAWKSHYESEHLELVNYRANVHDKNDATNARIVALSSENAELRTKTDLSPISESLKVLQSQGELKVKLISDFVQEQTKINSKILSALTNVEQRINGKRRKADTFGSAE